MTDRVSHLTVVLDTPVRTDDIQSLIDAISLLRGVCAVERGNEDPMETVARATVAAEMRAAIFAALD